MEQVKTADEMFTQLRYILEEKSIGGFAREDLLIYHKGNQNQAIVFSKTNRVFYTCMYEDIRNDTSTTYGITVRELEAIIKKCQELGWL